MNRHIFLAIVMLCFCLALAGPAFPASAASPKPAKSPPALPDVLAPLTPLVPTTDIAFTVVPRNPPVVKVCTNRDKLFFFEIREKPYGMTLKEAHRRGRARLVLTKVQVTIQEDGNTIDTVTSDLIGMFQTWSYRPKKTGEHVLTFTAETDTIKATQTVNVKAVLCLAEVIIHFKESVHAGPLPNEFTANIRGQIEADENGNVKPASLEGSFQIFEDVSALSALSQCRIGMPDMSGEFAVSASGTATDDSVDLKLDSGPIVVGPYTFSFACPQKSFTRRVPAKSVGLDAMSVASLSFPPDGGSRSFSLPKTAVLVGTGMKYADATVSLEAVD